MVEEAEEDEGFLGNWLECGGSNAGELAEPKSEFWKNSGFRGGHTSSGGGTGEARFHPMACGALGDANFVAARTGVDAVGEEVPPRKLDSSTETSMVRPWTETEPPVLLARQYSKSNYITSLETILQSSLMKLDSVDNGWVEIVMTVDSGATESVMGPEHAPGVPATPSPQSVAGVLYEVANGTKIKIQGEKHM